MANWCDIQISFPLEDIPKKEQKDQLSALYRAEKKWTEAVKDDPELRIGKNYQASQPGVPHERTQHEEWADDPKSPFGKTPTGKIAPDEQQFNFPSISAGFDEVDGRTWVSPYFELSVPPKDEDTFLHTVFEPSRNYRYSFPWWSQVGFAGAKKVHGGQMESETEQGMAFLHWELPVAKVLSNLGYVIDVHKSFPVSGNFIQWSWLGHGLHELQKLHAWLIQANDISDKALATLDWSEAAWNMMTLEEVEKNNDPNELMASIKKMQADIKKLCSGKMALEDFNTKYAEVE